MRYWFDKLTAWLVHHTWFMAVAVVLITLIAVQGYRNPASVRQFFIRNAPAESQTRENRRENAVRNNRPSNSKVEAVDLTRGDAILVIDSKKFFTRDGAKALQGIVDRLEELDYVSNVLWMDKVPILNIFGLPEPLFPRGEASANRYAAVREKALNNPLVIGQLLSADGETTILVIRFDWLFVRSDQECTEQIKQVAQSVANQFSDLDFKFQVTGAVPMYVAAIRSQQANVIKYQIIGYGMICLMALILFRGFSAVLVCALAPALGVFWTLGIIRFLNLERNPFNDVVLPVMLALVGLTDGVHLMVQIRKLRSEGLSGRDAAIEGIREVGFACFLTSLTTAIGFGSLYLANHEVVREFGYCCVIGVILTFIAVILAIPLACMTPLGNRIHIGQDKSLIDQHLSRISVLIDWVLGRPKAITVTSFVLTAICLVFALQLKPDERNVDRLPGGSEAALGMTYMDKAFGGLEFGSVDIDWKESVSSDDVEVMQVISEVDSLLRSEPLIGHPLGLKNLVDALPGEGLATERFSMVELLPPPLKRSFYRPDENYARVTFRIQDLGIAKYSEVFGRIENGFKSIQEKHPNFTLALSGSAAWRWRNLFQVVMDLASSLGSAALIIFAVLAIAYRSIWMGLASIVPNAFPLALTGTVLYWSGQSLEIVTVCSFTICLGIAVDDTIHFLTRFEQERLTGGTVASALRRSFVGVGSALIMTTVILVAGFSTVLLSDSRDHRIFAVMGVLTISTALLGDLIFLPAILWFTYGRKEKKDSPES
jgi:predicted RND superfamily exporter protein